MKQTKTTLLVAISLSLTGCFQFIATLGIDIPAPTGDYNIRVDNTSNDTIIIDVNQSIRITDNVPVAPGETGRLIFDVENDDWIVLTIEDDDSDNVLVLARMPRDFVKGVYSQITDGEVRNWHIEFVSF